MRGNRAYSRTRTWFRPCEDGVTEKWWFMDEYDSAEAFEAMQTLVRSLLTGERGARIARQTLHRACKLPAAWGRRCRSSVRAQ